MNIDCVRKKCCVCRNCQNVCPVNAIDFVCNQYGFEYPEIDLSKCINCGKCKTVCPMLNVNTNNADVIDCGVAYALDEQIKFNGSSGGIFGLFAEEIISEGGIVFGAAFDEELKLKTTSAETSEELLPLYKSKYLLCNTDTAFKNIEKCLMSGRDVLYCSSPCQIAALRLYLGKEYDNLLTIDFVCHGVGSQMLFDKSVEYYEKKTGTKISKFIFRYKKPSTTRCFSVEYEKKGRKKRKNGFYFFFPYYNAYYKNYIQRDNCYNCPYASKGRTADITVGDFHEIAKYNSKINREKGCSMLLINTEKGRAWFEKASENMYFEHIDKEILYQSNRFAGKIEKPKNRDIFLESVSNETFETTVKRFLKPRKEWKKLIYYKMPSGLRNKLKKLL